MGSPTFARSEKSPVTGYSGGGPEPPRNSGKDGDNHDSGGSPDYGQRLRRARLGLFFAAASILVLFTTFSVVFLVTHQSLVLDERSNSLIRNWKKISLPTGLLIANTLLLLGSSLTIEMARRTIGRDVALSPVRSIPGIAVGRERGQLWLMVTAFLGVAFLCGQGLAWRNMSARGLNLSSGASSSFVYLLTGTHALHLAGGILVLFRASISFFSRQPVEARHIIVDVSAWYWHFMLVLWIYIFVLLELAN